MRRFLAAAVIALLAIMVATPVQAGYLILRVILEGGAAPSTSSGPGSGSRAGPGVTDRGIANKPGTGLGGSTPQAAGTAKTQEPSRCVVVVVPIEENITRPSNFYRRAEDPERNPTWAPKIHSLYRGEKYVTNLFVDNVTIQMYPDLLKSPAPTKTRVTELHGLYEKWAKTKSDPKQLFGIFSTALAIGQVNDAVVCADELLALAAEKADGLPADLKTFLTAYGKIQKDLKGVAANNPRAEAWRKKLGAQTVRSQGHYSLISWDATELEVKRRLDFLEENFRAYFLWHATQGIVLPVPEVSLLAVLTKDASSNDHATVLGLDRLLDGPARLTADGFYSPDHDLLVLSPDRSDDAGLTFVRQTQQMFQAGVTRPQLLSGDGPVISVSGQNKDGKKPDEVARMQTTALVSRLVEDNSTIGSVSREGSRQLFYATGQLTRYVVLPEWLGNGSASFFARSREPAFVTNAEGKPVMHVAMTTGYGVPNYAMQRYFKDLQDKNDLHPNRALFLKNVLTDAYFTGLREHLAIHDPDPVKADTSGVAIATAQEGPGPGPGPGGPSRPGGPGKPTPGMGGPGGPGRPGGPGGPTGAEGAPKEEDPNVVARRKRERLTIKAQASSWALYYYLAKARHAELETFLHELAEMPRDVPLEGAALAAFYHAFKIDPAHENEGLEQLAQAWLGYMNSVPLAGQDVTIVPPKGSESDPKTSDPKPNQ